MTRPIDDLDVRREQLEADVRALVARQRLADGIAAEARHLMDPNEGPIEAAFAQLACDCDDPCACNDGSQP